MAACSDLAALAGGGAAAYGEAHRDAAPHEALEPHHYQERQYWLAHGASVEAVPRSVVRASIALSWCTMTGALLDFVVEGLILGGVIPKLPLRVEFLVLVALTALLGFHTLRGIRRCELDVTVDALQVGIFTEAAIVVADVHFLATHRGLYAACMRAPFVAASAVNITLMLYIASRLHVFPEFFHRRKAQKRRKQAAREWKNVQVQARRNARRARKRAAESSPDLAIMLREAEKAARRSEAREHLSSKRRVQTHV